MDRARKRLDRSARPLSRRREFEPLAQILAEGQLS